MATGVEFDGVLKGDLGCNVRGVDGFRLCFQCKVQIGNVLVKTSSANFPWTIAPNYSQSGGACRGVAP